MPIRIGDGFMRLEIDGRVIATATERAGGRSPAGRGSSTATRPSPRSRSPSSSRADVTAATQ
jgi:hypothetical protein